MANLAIGDKAIYFDLPGVDDKNHALGNYADSDLLAVIFYCNHCPYVLAWEDRLIQAQRDYADRGVQFILISSNDPAKHPIDDFPHMKTHAQEKGFPFPYLYDESQAVAKAYRAACTPDFFLFDAERKLVYRGQFDDSRPGNDLPIDGKDLRSALDALLNGAAPTVEQKASVGCNIKWKAGAEPDYFG